MKVKFDFSLENKSGDFKVGAYLSLLSFSSLLIILSGYFILRGEDTILIQAPENDSLIMPWWGWIIVLIISSAGFYIFYKKHNSILFDSIQSQKVILNDIDTEFPITSSAEILAKKTVEIQDQISFIFFVILLSFGWTLVLVPFALVGVIFYIISKFTSAIIIEGQVDIGIVIMWTLFWIVGIVLQGAFYGLFRQSEELKTLTGDLEKLNITSLMKDPDLEETSF